MAFGFGFAQPYQSRLGGIAAHVAATQPKMMAMPQAPAIDLSSRAGLPGLPSAQPEADKPLPLQTAPAPVDSSAVTPVSPPPGYVPGLTTGIPAFTPTPGTEAAAAPAAGAAADGAAAGGGNIADLIAAIFGA